MRRRDFFRVAVGSVTVPIAARAQQIDRIRRIGILLGFVADDPRGQDALATLLKALQQLGWIDGRNVRIDYRLAGGNAEDLRKYAAELVTLGPDVL
jgi:putative tryptophan/tyrosine transport system substrate-binding protein